MDSHVHAYVKHHLDSLSEDLSLGLITYSKFRVLEKELMSCLERGERR